MKFIITRELLLEPLLQIVNVIEKRQTMPILSNVLLKLENNELILTGTDLEIQIIAKVVVDSTSVSGVITVPARKILDICRSLPAGENLKIELVEDKIKIISGRSRFSLSTLDAGDYPEFVENEMDCKFSMNSGKFKSSLDKTIFSMANQDVRYYLNGLLLNISNQFFKLVASDGHRLAVYEDQLDQATGYESRIILPRKGVSELNRILDDSDANLTIEFCNSNIKICYKNLIFSAKLIDAKYPEFSKVFIQEFYDPLTIPKKIIKDALTRVAILSNEKFKGVLFDLTSDNLTISTHNPEHEEAEETLPLDNFEDTVSISFNAQYLLDAVTNLDSEFLILTIAANGSCCFIEEPDNPKYRFIVMSMRM